MNVCGFGITVSAYIPIHFVYIPQKALLRLKHPRSNYFRNLKKSIKEDGMIQPIIVYRVKKNVFMIKDGIHRYQIARKLKYRFISCQWMETLK